jgi:hypothetical protein
LVETIVGLSDNDSFVGNARVQVSRSEADYWIIGWKDDDAFYLDRSSDGGSNWTSLQTVGSDVTDTGSGRNSVGIDVNGTRLAVIAKDGTQNDAGEYIYFVYHTTSKTGAPAKVTNPTDWEVNQGALALTNSTTALVGLTKDGSPTPDNALDIVDFDGSYPDFSIGGGPSTSGEATSGTFPAQNDLAYGSAAEPGSGFVNVTVTVDLTALYSFSEVSYWTNFALNSSISDRRSTHNVWLLDENDAEIAHWSEVTEGSFATGTFTVTSGDLGASGDERVSKVRVNIYLEYNHVSGTGSNFVFLDDIDITADLIEYDGVRAMHSLDLSGPTYTERSSHQLLPFDTYGIAVSTLSSSDVSMIAYDENGDHVTLLQSSNGGGTWVQRRSVPGMVGIKRAGSTVIMHGYNRLELSADAGLSSYSMLGNWQNKLGAVGLIRAVAGVLS